MLAPLPPPNGIYRACQITEFINKLAKEGYPISYIVTSNPCNFNTESASMRPQQTIAPASFLLNIPTYIYGVSSDIQSVLDAIYDTSYNSYNGTNIVICWEHSSIQQLLLGVVEKAIEMGRITNPNVINYNVFDYFKDYSGNFPNPCPGGNYINPTGSTDPDAYDPSYSYIPYWNTYCYDLVFWLKGNTSNTNMDFYSFLEPCLTCYPNCNPQICGYQQPSTCLNDTLHYSNEKTCGIPPST